MGEIHTVSFTDPNVTPAELREHRRSFVRFERLVLFAVLHISSILAALALAFLGDAPVFGFLFGLAVNLGLIVAAAQTNASDKT